MRDLFSGTELYHSLDQVGQGTFGKVAKYWRSSDGELVAIKRMRLKLHGGVIHNELKLLGALRRLDSSSSHIVQFFEAFCDQTHHYLVFELLQKNILQLQEEAHFRPMAVRHIRAIACQMLKALQKLEEISIIHGDLKPENIMLVDHIRRPFRVKLIDFGSASIFSEVCVIKEPYIQSRFYRSPEILLGLPFSGRMDMWSLGCVMSELYLGWPLYPGESEMEQVRFICETQGLPPCSLLDTASKAHLFFTLTKSSLGERQWRLKSRVRRSASGEEGHGTGQEAAGRDRRKHILSSLDQLASLELTGHQREDRAAEETDRLSMVDLLKMILTLDAQKRIAPFDALCHPFITTEHLSSSPELSQYHKACRLAMQQAGIWDKEPVGDISSQCQHLPQSHRPNTGSASSHTKQVHLARDEGHGPCPQRPLAPAAHHDFILLKTEELKLESANVSEPPSSTGRSQEHHVQLPSFDTTHSATVLPVSQPMDIPAYHFQQYSPAHSYTYWPYRVFPVKTTLDHHHYQCGFQQPQYRPGEVLPQLLQGECLFLGQRHDQDSQTCAVHHSYLPRTSESHQSYHQPAHSSYSDPYQYGMGRMDPGLGHWPQLQTEAQSQSCPEPLTQLLTQAQATAVPQHWFPSQSQTVAPYLSDSLSLPQHQLQSPVGPDAPGRSQPESDSQAQTAPLGGGITLTPEETRQCKV